MHKQTAQSDRNRLRWNDADVKTIYLSNVSDDINDEHAIVCVRSK